VTVLIPPGGTLSRWSEFFKSETSTAANIQSRV
jgi:peptide subunit release factor 1 (eRF1)